MCIQPNLAISPAGLEGFDSSDHSAIALGQALLNEAIRVRKGFDWNADPTVLSVITSFFFFGCYFCVNRHNLAWFHLREATTIAQLIGMHVSSSQSKLTLIPIANTWIFKGGGELSRSRHCE